MVSIVIPFLNEERYIDRCIDSVLAQDCGKENTEIMFIDGGSMDGSRKMIERFVSNNKNTRLLNNPNRIVSSGLNIGIREARGECILILSGHALLRKDYISSCLKKMGETGADCVGGKVTMSSDTFIKRAIAIARSSLIGGSIMPHRYSNQGCFVRTAAYGLYRREVFDKIGMFDEKMVHDQDEELNWRLFKGGLRIYYNPDAKADYIQKRGFASTILQLFRHAFWKAKTTKKHAGFLRFSFVIPSLFVLSLAVFSAAGLADPLYFYILSAQLILYLAVLLSFSLWLSLKNGIGFFFALPAAYLLVHISTGLGFLAGFIKK